MAEPNPQHNPPRRSLLSPRIVKLLAIAFGVGLLMFLFLWMDQRNDTDFFKASKPGSESSDEAGLPTPLPADVASDDQNASGLRLPAPGARPDPPASELPRIVEPATPTLPPPPSQPWGNAPAPASDAYRSNDTTPIAINRPSPNYPREALRRGLGGTVRVEVNVTADGRVERMDLAESSGDRFLDRAAMEAVRRWRFRPAMRNGQPVAATVVVPLEFNPGR